MTDQIVGVNIHKDTRQIEKALGIRVANVFPIENIGKILLLKKCSLKQLSSDYAGIKLEKGKGGYQWDSCKETFPRRSAEYAANDAISSLLVFRKMLSFPKTELHEQITPPQRTFTSEELASHTQFYVNSSKGHRIKLPNFEIDRKKYLKIIERIEEVARNNPVSCAKLVRIINQTFSAFPKNDPLSEEKARNLISLWVERGYLIVKNDYVV